MQMQHHKIDSRHSQQCNKTFRNVEILYKSRRLFCFALEKATFRAYFFFLLLWMLDVFLFFFFFSLSINSLILWSLFIAVRVKNAECNRMCMCSFVGLRFHFSYCALHIKCLLIIIRSVVVCLHALITICSGKKEKKNQFWQFQRIVRKKYIRKLRNSKLVCWVC